MKNNILVTSLCILCLLFSNIALALNLDEAKDQGLVGEKDNGYLGLVVEQNEVLSLIEDINAKRKAVYLKLAEKNGISLQQVEKLAALKAYQKTQSGHYLWTDGQWLKK